MTHGSKIDKQSRAQKGKSLPPSSSRNSRACEGVAFTSVTEGSPSVGNSVKAFPTSPFQQVPSLKRFVMSASLGEVGTSPAVACSDRRRGSEKAGGSIYANRRDRSLSQSSPAFPSYRALHNINGAGSLSTSLLCPPSSQIPPTPPQGLL